MPFFETQSFCDAMQKPTNRSTSKHHQNTSLLVQTFEEVTFFLADSAFLERRIHALTTNSRIAIIFETDLYRRKRKRRLLALGVEPTISGPLLEKKKPNFLNSHDHGGRGCEEKCRHHVEVNYFLLLVQEMV